MKVERLTVDQLFDEKIRDAIMKVGNEFIAEAKYPFPLKRSHFFPFWMGIVGQKVGEFYVAKRGDEIVGVFGGMFAPDGFSGEMHAAESFWFVTPSARGSTAAIKMFRLFEADAAARGCAAVVMMNLANLGEEGLTEFYERCGYARAEQVYRKVI